MSPSLRLFFALVAAAVAAPLAATPLLSVRGVCPGVMAVTVSGAQPNGNVVFFKSSSRGADTIAGGPCVGTPLGLDNASRVTVQPADAAGRIEVSPNLTEAVCDQYLQVVDLATCEASATAQLSAVQVIAATGDPVDGGAEPLLITTIASIAVNSAGEWLVAADTNALDPAASDVLLKNGGLLLREGDVLADPDPPPPFMDEIDLFDSVTLNEESRSALTFCTDGGVPDDDDCVGTSDDDSAVFLDSELAAAEGRSGGAFDYSTILEAKINKDADLLVAAAIDPPSPDRALVLIDEIDGETDEVIVRVGGPLVGLDVEEIRVGPHGYAFNDVDQVLFVAEVSGAPAVDTLIFLEPDDLVLAREGVTFAPPPNSKLYADLTGPLGARVGLNSAGSAAWIAPVVGPCCTAAEVVAPIEITTTGCTPEPVDAVLVHDPDPSVANDEVLVAEIGDEFPAGSGNTICGFGLPLELDDGNGIVYSVMWNDPDTCPEALVRWDGVTSQVLLEAGDLVVIDGAQAEIANLCGDSTADERRCYDISPSGEVLGVRATLTDGREVALLMSI